MLTPFSFVMGLPVLYSLTFFDVTECINNANYTWAVFPDVRIIIRGEGWGQKAPNPFSFLLGQKQIVAAEAPIWS